MLQLLFDLSLRSLISIAFGAWILYALLQILLDPLRDIPGPWLARFTRLWYIFEIYKGTFELTNIDLHQRYGPIVRIAPNEYSIDDFDAARKIYGPGSAFVKAPWYTAWMPPGPSKANLFGEQDPARHASQRRKFASAYSMSSLVEYESHVDECSSALAQRFEEIATSKQTVNLGHWLQFYAFDVIGVITFARRFGLLDTGEDKGGILKAIEDRSAYATFAGNFPSLHPVLFPLIPKTGGYTYFLNFTQQTMEAREKSLKGHTSNDQAGPTDFVTKFLNAHAAQPERITKVDILTICSSNVGAGSDTTAITLSAILYHLLKNPSTYRCLQSEIDNAADEGRLSNPITFKESQSLPYLQAVIKEALRLHPATGLPMSRLVPSSGATLAGRSFPAGTTIGINSWVAHRNTSIYGPDAHLWRPERWLEFEAQGRGAEVEKYFFAFGMGSRTCIGKNISLLEMGKVVPLLVGRFNFALDNALGEGREWRTLSRWFVKQVDFRGKIVLRDGVRQ